MLSESNYSIPPSTLSKLVLNKISRRISI